MPESIRPLLKPLFFALFAGSFLCRAAQAFLSIDSPIILPLFFFLPVVVYLGFYTLLFPKQGFKPSGLMAYILLFLALSFFLSWILADEIVTFGYFISLRTAPHAAPLLTSWDVFTMILLGTVFCSAMLFVTRRYHSIWFIFALTVIAWMLLFSYSARTWSILFPIHLAGAVLYQMTLALPSRNRYWLWLSLALSLSFILGFYVPAFKAVWFQAPAGNADYTNKNTLFAWKKFQLGEPFQPSEEPLFYVQSPKPQYWRSEAYDTFERNGWAQEGSKNQTKVKSPLTFNTPPKDSEPFLSQVKNLNPLAPDVGILLPQNPVSVEFKNKDSFLKNHNLDTLMTVSSFKKSQIYTVTSYSPSYTAADLRKVPSLSAIAPGYNRSPAPPHPDIKALAETITQNENGPYDKITALISFLKKNCTYTYDPSQLNSFDSLGRTGDFVYTFLFTSREGYCVHFSSALVLMAQSLGYPARWVVGFNTGDSLPSGVKNPFPDKPENTVKVLSQANAHSWAEIYFPDYGWVPFEPTPGFSALVTEASNSTSQPQSEATSPVERENNRNKDDDPTANRLDDMSPIPSKKGLGDIPLPLIQIAVSILVFASLLIGIALILKSRPYLKPGMDQEKIRLLYLYWRKRLVRLDIEYLPQHTIQEHSIQLTRLGAEWVSAWDSFSQTAEKAFYAPALPVGSLRKSLSNHRRLKLLYRKTKRRL